MRQILVLVTLAAGCDAAHVIATGSPDGSVTINDDALTILPIPPDGALDSDGGALDPDSGVPPVWVNSSAFAFDYQQRTASAATLTSAVLFSPTQQLIAGEAGVAFITDDAWATQTRVRTTLDGEVRELVRLDDQHALAITKTGEIALAAQAGRAWTSCASTAPAGTDLRAASVVRIATTTTTSAYDVVAVGINGTILRGTVRVGGSYACGPFVPVASPTPYTLLDVAADPQTGIVVAVGRQKVRSTDFGQTYTAVDSVGGYGGFNAVSSLGNGAGFLFSGPRTIGSPSNSRLLWSTDGDVLVQQAAFLGDYEVKAVTAVDAQHAWIFGGTPPQYVTSRRVSLATLVDGAWTETVTPQPPGAVLYSIGTLAALDANHATWVSASGQIVSTHNGQTWTSHTGGSGTSIHDLQFVGSSATSVWAVNATGQVLRTDDAGGVWTLIPAADKSLTSIASPSDAVTFAVGSDGVILRRTATGFELDPFAFSTPSLVDIDCVDVSRCYAVGLKRAFIEWNGSSWSAVPGITAATTSIMAIDVIDSMPRRGVAVGAAGSVFTMLGASWIEQPAIAGVDLTYVALAADASGLAFALGTTADDAKTPLRFRSSDYGATWTLDATLVELNLPRGITEDTADGSWYMLGYASMYKSTDDGASWRRLSLPVSYLIQNDVAARGGHVFVVGNVGMVMHSASAGEVP